MNALIIKPKIDWDDEGDWETSIEVSSIRDLLGVVQSVGVHIAVGNALWEELTASDLNVSETPVVIVCGLNFEFFQSQLMIKPFFQLVNLAQAYIRETDCSAKLFVVRVLGY